MDGLAGNRECHCSDTGGSLLFVPLPGQRSGVFSCHSGHKKECTYYLWPVNNTVGLRGNREKIRDVLTCTSDLSDCFFSCDKLMPTGCLIVTGNILSGCLQPDSFDLFCCSGCLQIVTQIFALLPAARLTGSS